MATSGAVNTNSYDAAYLRLEWTRTSYDSANGINYVHWVLKGVKSTSGYYYARKFKVTSYNFVTGVSSQLYYSESDIQLRDGTVIAEGDDSFTANPDGSCRIQFNIEGAIYTYAVNCTGYDNWDLDRIPRYMDYVWISQRSKTSSSISIDWSTSHARDWTQYSLNGGSWKDAGDVVASNSKSGYFTIKNLSANTSYSIKIRCRRTDSQLWSESGSLSITTYAKTIPTISLSSKTVNSITVSSSCNVSVSSTQYRIKISSGSYGSYQTSATFSGLVPNTAYVIEVKKVGSASGESGTATLSVTTYDIARLTSYPNFNLGDNVTLRYTNPSGAAIEVGIYDTAGQNGYAFYRKATGTSYTFSFTDEELDRLYKAMNGNSVQVRMYINTNNNAYRDSKTVTVTLTGNQKTAHRGQKRAKVYIENNGIKRGVLWIGVDGACRRCI